MTPKPHQFKQEQDTPDRPSPPDSTPYPEGWSKIPLNLIPKSVQLPHGYMRTHTAPFQVGPKSKETPLPADDYSLFKNTAIITCSRQTAQMHPLLPPSILAKLNPC